MPMPFECVRLAHSGRFESVTKVRAGSLFRCHLTRQLCE